MQEYSLVSPGGSLHTLRVDVGGRVALALPGRTVGYMGRSDARRLAHDLLKALEPVLDSRERPRSDGDAAVVRSREG